MSFRLAIICCTLSALLMLSCSNPDSAASGVSKPLRQYENTPLEAHVAPESFRFDLRMDDAEITATPARDDSTFVRRFDFAAGHAPWTISDGEGSCNVTDDALVISADTLLRCDSPDLTGVEAIAARAVFIDARVSDCSQFVFAWRGEGGEFATKYETTIDVVPSDKPVLYSLDTGPLPNWNSHLGNVGQLRIIVPEKATMKIRSIGLAARVDKFAGKSYGRMVYSALKRKHTHSMYARTPASLEYDVTVMPNARLTTEFFNPDSIPARYRIVLEDAGNQTVLAEERVASGNRRPKVSADLSQWEGNQVRIRFEAESDEPGKVAMWFNPALERVYPLTESKRPMNVVWYVIDCLRPNNLSVYGYERDTTPTMTAVAEEGALFNWCFAPGSWTVDSVASFLTGMSPNAHGMLRIHQELPESMRVLPEIMREAGYVTGLFSQNPYVDKHLGYVRGFDEAYRYRVRGAGVKVRTAETYPLNMGIADFLKRHRERPQFLYVHTIEPHGPNIPPASLRVFAQPDGTVKTMELYDACVLWADLNLGHTIQHLKEEGLWNNTLLIVSADHGQSFPEVDDGLVGHGEAPHFSRAWIPLIMRLPGFIPEGTTFEENVQALEIPRTLFDLLGIEPDPQFEGMSLMGLLDGSKKEEFAQRAIFSTGQRTSHQAVIKDHWFFLDIDGKGELLDFHTDYAQTANVIDSHPDVAQKLLDETRGYREVEVAKADQHGVAAPNSLAVDLERRRELEALGYLE